MPHSRARRLARRVAAAVTAVSVAAGPLVLGVLAQPALAQQSAAARLSVYIQGVTPQWAESGHAVTVTGIVRNSTAAPIRGLSIQLRSSGFQLQNRDDLSLYQAGNLDGAAVPEGLPVSLPVLAPGKTVRWKAILDPAAAGMTLFGVYPLAAQLLNGLGLPVASDRTFLPYWPGRSSVPQLQPLSIAWVWPILDRPYNGVCGTLLSNDLAASVAPGGRLNGLLTVGSSYSAAAHLTWAVDPAVAQTAQTMSHRYAVSAGPGCGDGRRMRADRAAGAWLNALTSAISGQQVFLTPFADVDVNALSHVGLDGDLRSAYTEGRTVGSQILHLPAGADTTAWPPTGQADSGTLDSLAINQISTVVLNSTVMPPAGPVPNYTPSAQTTVNTGIGSSLRVLLADQTISRILDDPSTGPTANPGSAFATQQSFLAQTAMIVAERPATARSLVVTPPRVWNPAPGLAAGLLNDTVHAPWLHPASLAGLAADRHPAGQVARQQPPDHHVSKYELSAAYLGRVASLGAAVRLQASIFVPAVPGYLQSPIAALESANWPGTRAQAATARHKLLAGTLSFVNAQARKVTILDSNLKITLGGSSGKVPVSISNGMTTAVRVVLHASAGRDSRLSVGSFDGGITISAGQTRTIRLPLHSGSVGVTDVTLSLYSPNGTQLPKTTVRLTVQATRFGTLALVIMCVALGVFVLTSSARAIRRSRRDGGEEHDNDSETSDPPGPAAIPGSVRSGDDLANDHPPEDPDEYADARGRARR